MNDPAVIITRVIEGHMPFINWPGSPSDRCACDGCDWTGPDPAAHRIHQGQAAAEALGHTVEWAVRFEKPTPDRIDTREITVEQKVSDAGTAAMAVRNRAPLSGRSHRIVTRYVTPWTPEESK